MDLDLSEGLVLAATNLTYRSLHFERVLLCIAAPSRYQIPKVRGADVSIKPSMKPGRVKR